MYVIHQIGIFVHVIGILLIGGGVVGTFFVQRLFWGSVNTAPDAAKRFLQLLLTFSVIFPIGALLLLLSGVLMLYSVDWGFVGQYWFIVKMAAFLVLFFNGKIVGVPTLKTIEQNLSNYDALGTLKFKLARFYKIQHVLLAIVLLLGVFKFSF